MPPVRAAVDEMFTITPPAPPYRLDIRCTASRQHRNTPPTFTSSTRRTVEALCSSSRPGVLPVIAALLTTPASGPSSAAASKSPVTSSSTATSPRTVSACRPSLRTCEATSSAATRSDA
jgi:hypothetical protein